MPSIFWGTGVFSDFCQVCNGRSLAVYLLWPTFDPLFVGTDGTHFLRSLDGGPKNPPHTPAKIWNSPKQIGNHLGGDFPSSPRQAGIVQSTVRLVKQLLTLSPVMFIFQAKVSTLGFVCSFWLWDEEFLWRWKKLKNERNWRGGLSTGGRFKAPICWFFPSLHNSNWIWINELKGTFFFEFLQYVSIHLWCVDSIWEISNLSSFRSSPKASSPSLPDRSLASIPWTSWNLVAPLTPDGLRYP